MAATSAYRARISRRSVSSLAIRGNGSDSTLAADAKFGEAPPAVVDATEPIDADAVIDHCTRHLAGFRNPRFADQLHRNDIRTDWI